MGMSCLLATLTSSQAVRPRGARREKNEFISDLMKSNTFCSLSAV